ncbi:MAG: DNA topoisomerase (ATP-hydrolyzing) subunit B [Spiroplasma sp.]|nr:DNA topoisomerase (ATP-hydrolyzing) subunit B [Mycoplasmatales bacterium]
MDKKNNNYDASNIDVLEGLEAVRKRPSMYIGSTAKKGLHHLVWEIVDNSIDEALAGYATKIEIVINKGNSITVSDNGRGIPVDIHKKTNVSALETIMTVLHAGGKFGGGGYKVSGGLHGVGASVVNALSSKMIVHVHLNGKLYLQEYAKGEPLSQVKELGPTNKTGTEVTFQPDAEIFKETTIYDYDELATRLKELSYLNKGLFISIKDERTNGKSAEFYCQGGILEYVKGLNKGKEPVHELIFACESEENEIIVDIAFQYNQGYSTSIMSYVNNIRTQEGGTHEEGLKTTLTRTLNSYAKKNNLFKEESLLGEDTREGITAIISIKHPHPQFEGQTKTKLGNSDARVATISVFSVEFERFLMENPKDAKLIIEKGLTASRARQAAKKARELTRKKSIFESTSLPGKLSDCSSKDPEVSEIYIVEGDSAGGSAKQGRDRHFQAILPLRGKVLNVEKATQEKIMANEEIAAMAAALGTGLGSGFAYEKLRYKKIVIMTDTDVDGAPIRTLLLSFLFRFMKPLIEEGNIYIAQPPLYKIYVGKKIEYAYNDDQKDAIIASFPEPEKVNIQRYKGLGEMNPEQLWETTMDPEVRTLLKINIEDAILADKIFETLMGESTTNRKIFIQENAKYAKVDV